MPELPEVETVKREIAKDILNKKIVEVKNSSFSLRKKRPFKTKLIQNSISKVERWGKKLYFRFSSGLILESSLGMSGMFRVEKSKYQARKHDHFILSFVDQSYLVYNDPRRFGWLTEVHEISKKSWDPLLGTLKQKREFEQMMSHSSQDLYRLLMDQDKVQGLGNIYVQEVLFESGLSPFKAAKDCSPEQLKNLTKNIKKILKRSLSYGGSTILSYSSPSGEKGGFQKSLKVYGKKKGEACLICDTPLTYVKRQRSVSYCSHCQR